jgi:DNA-directed RNA polymerase delta subunit
VYAALRRRESVTGDIMRVGEEWGLKEWFSNIAKPKAAKAAKRKKTKKKTASKKTASKASVANPKPASAPELKIVKSPEQKSDAQANEKPISMVDAVDKILEEADKPLHAGVLVQKLKTDYGKETNVKSIAASLPQDSVKRFTNIGGNTWVLERWPAPKKVKAATATA